MFLDDTACNLASLNLLKFVRHGRFDVELFAHAARILIVAQDILVDHAGYPTEQIAGNSHNFRPLGLGYANLGALLMSMGLAYNSGQGRGVAAAITALMGGSAYRASAEMAASMQDLTRMDSAAGLNRTKSGAFLAYQRNALEFLSVIRRHRSAADALGELYPSLDEELRAAATSAWAEAEYLGSQSGFRNAQVTVLAPTGTIGFMMDCDTTGIEPMLGVIVFKKLAGGGHLTLVNQAVETALANRGYAPSAVEEIKQHILSQHTIEGAPQLRESDLPIFDCAFRPAKGSRSIHWRGHLQMMAAVQPFLSGAISKTVNLPEESTVADIEAAYLEAWRLGVKAVAIYRDGSKSSQPVSTKAGATDTGGSQTATETEDLSAPPSATRHRLQDERSALTHHFSIAGHEGYLTVGLYPNGEPGEIFIRMAKAGSTIAGLMECFGTVVSIGLQHGVPLKVLCDKLAHTRFEPSGWTGNQEIGYAKSIMDYLFRWMELRFLSGNQMPLFRERQATDPPRPPAHGPQTSPVAYELGDGPPCTTCGELMARNGTCYKCVNCGGTSGCS